MRPIRRDTKGAHSRRGITLVEVIVTASLLVLVVGTAAFALSSVFTAYRNTSAQLDAYQQVVALERAIKVEASYATDIAFTAPADPAPYSTFGFTGPDSVFMAVLSTRDADLVAYAEGNERSIVTFDAVEALTYEVLKVGNASRLDYEIVASDDSGPVRLAGGVILNNLNTLPTAGEILPGGDTALYLLPASVPE